MESRTHAVPATVTGRTSAAGLRDLPLRPHPRPLSDIREITEPNLLKDKSSLIASSRLHIPLQLPARSYRGRGLHKSAPKFQRVAPLPRTRRASCCSFVSSVASSTDRSSVYTIPSAHVPPRASSKAKSERQLSVRREPAVRLPHSFDAIRYVENTGKAHSPVKYAVDRIDPRHREHVPRIPSKTIIKIRNPSSESILEHPSQRHPRIKVDLLIAAPLFVGGSSCEGTVRIVVDGAERLRHKKTLTLEKLSVDLLGVEEVLGSPYKKHVFLALGNELVDPSHPPPNDMVDPQTTNPPSKRSWTLVPSVSTLPFLLQLPLNVGPPLFRSRHARIRYILCATLTIKDAERQLSVRCSQETALLSIQDPEKALISLPSPLAACEDVKISKSGDESIIVTAGLHRQVWVSGTTLFTDVHIVNNSHRVVKKLELELERMVLCYRHAVAATLEVAANASRMFDHRESKTISRTVIRLGKNGWKGVAPHTTLLRTFDLEIPRGHATISCHKFFEVRFYLYARVYMSRSCTATIQLPVHIIHMNSLDIPTNTVAQVAAAVYDKKVGRSMSSRLSKPQPRKEASVQSLQGRAFAAPRMQSLERIKAKRTEMEELDTIVNSNAALRAIKLRKGTFKFKTPPSNRKGRLFNDQDAYELRRRLNETRAASFDSNDSQSTERSVPRSKYPHRESTNLKTYLEEQKNESSEDLENTTHASHAARKSSNEGLDYPPRTEKLLTQPLFAVRRPRKESAESFG